jgi:glucose-1-phosphate thymidylyltransferase
MKALLLSGGVGSRLRPFTHTMAKQLVPVAGRPVLVHCLETIRDAGIKQVGLVVGDRGTDIRRAVGTGAELGLRITYLRQEAPLGLAHCVLIAREFLGDDDFVLYLGDNVMFGGIEPMLSDFRKRGASALLAVAQVANPAEYGIAEVTPDGRVLSVAEKPVSPVSDLAIIGAYVFSPEIHQAVVAVKPSWRNEREITDAIQWLVRRGSEVWAYRHSGYWKDTGRVADVLDCNRALLGTLRTDIAAEVDASTTLSGPVVIDETARVSRSRLIGPLLIGANTLVSDSYVGPYTSIGADCTIESTALEHSIVMDSALVRGVGHIRDSVIGRRAKVIQEQPVGAHRLVLGDDSDVLLSP